MEQLRFGFAEDNGAAHRSRKAVVYLRQSSEQQVHSNTESQRL
jgi:hypothetical protein